MIRCTVTDLEERCRQRGLTFAEVRQCIVSEHGGGVITVDETSPAYPHPRKGLGDHVADGLSAIGITKERVSRLAGKNCGCKKRQQWLNEVGRRFLGIGGTPSE